MNKNNCNSTIRKSSSLYSLKTQLTSDNSILTSTTNQDTTSLNPLNYNRRKAIIPTPNRPKYEQKPPTMSSKKGTSTSQQTHIQKKDRDESQDKVNLSVDIYKDFDNLPDIFSDMSLHAGVDHPVALSTIIDDSNHEDTI